MGRDGSWLTNRGEEGHYAASQKTGEPLSDSAVRCYERKKAPDSSAHRVMENHAKLMGAWISFAFLGLVCVEMFPHRDIRMSF